MQTRTLWQLQGAGMADEIASGNRAAIGGLRDYQQEAVASALAKLESPGSSTLGVAATGLGKTQIFTSVAEHMARSGRVLILAHRSELVRQAAKRWSNMTGERADVEMASDRASHSADRTQVVVASKDTLIHRAGKYDWSEFSLVIIDEAHRAVAPRYQKIYDKIRAANPEIRLLGVTATPDRLDEKPLGKVFHTVAFDYSVHFGIENGWLVDIVQTPIYIESVDLSTARKSGRDLAVADLDAILTKEKPLWGMAKAIVENTAGRKTLVFCATVHHAELMTAIIAKESGERTEMITGKTDPEKRAAMLRDYARGSIRYMVNVDVFTEGYDEPTIEVVAMCKPTLSRAKYAQMIGRGTRVLPGVTDGCETATDRRQAIAGSGKPFLEVLDFAGLSGRHKLVTTIDILGDREGDEVIEQAKKLGATGMPARDVIERAKQMLAERERLRKEAAKRMVKHTSATVAYRQGDRVNPFDVLGIKPNNRPGFDSRRPPTDKMIALLSNRGIDNAADLTFQQARQLIGELVERQRENRPTYKQTRYLKSVGIDPSGWSFQQASNKISELLK